jgi:pimeloyl-ACP methyl ester carboxylesterase
VSPAEARARPALATGPAFSQHRVHLGDGRRVVCAEYGQRSELPIIYLHGFLGSRLEPRAAGETGANLIAVDRPGYGGSPPMARPSLAQFGRDLGEMLDYLAIGRCGILGVSAGGPYAVAAATMLGARVTHLVLAGAVADRVTIRSHGGTVRSIDRLRRHRPIFRLVLPRLLRHARHHGFDARLVHFVLRKELPLLRPGSDRVAVARALVASFREGLRPGLTGVLADVELLTKPWDVDPRDLRVPTTVLHGAKDTIVPVAHAAWYGRGIPGAHVEVLPDEGHISVVLNQVERILGAFASSSRAC